MARIKDLDKSMFWKLGAMKFSEEFEHLAKLTDVCTYDATLYATNEPKKCMIREATSFRPHLVRHLNLLHDETRNYIQSLWNISNSFISRIGVTPYQCFLVISNNKFSVGKHTHGDHMGDTITVVCVEGDDEVNTHLCIGKNIKLRYPNVGEIKAVCFDSDIVHHTESHDHNYYFHFVYDLTTNVDYIKNTWIDV